MISEKRKQSIAKWDREHTTQISIKLHNKNDSDIIEYLNGKNKQSTIKAAIRYYRDFAEMEGGKE